MEEKILLTLIFALTVEYVSSHAILVSPVARASAWRFDTSLAIQYPNPVDGPFHVIYSSIINSN